MAPEPIKILKNISLFSEFSLDDLAYVKSILIRKKYKKNDTIFYEGDDGSEMFIVRSGQVKILTTSADGQEMILGVLLPGDFFGEMSLLDNQPRSAMAVATAKETELLIIRQEEFLKLVREKASLFKEVMGELCRRLRTADEQIQDLVFVDVKERLVKKLISLAAKGTKKGDWVEIELKLTHKDLADMIGSSRETVSRILQELFDTKNVSMDRQKIALKVQNLKKSIKK